MNTYTNIENDSVTREAVTEGALGVMPLVKRKRGRPKMTIEWPDGTFTFNSLKQVNVLSSSSLRKKMRAELVRGGILKVNTLKTAFGRPLNVYQKKS